MTTGTNLLIINEHNVIRIFDIDTDIEHNKTLKIFNDSKNPNIPFYIFFFQISNCDYKHTPNKCTFSI